MSTVIVFSHLRWNFVRQRPQQLMSQLAGHHRVVFVEEPVHDTTAAAHLAATSPGPNLQVLVPHTPVAAPGFHDDQLPVLRPLVEAWLHDHAIDDYLVWFYTPMALPLTTQLRPRMVVYDCVAELAASRNAPRQLRQREHALMRVADLVLTSGPSLYQAKRTQHPNVHCLPSAVDNAHFAPPREAGSPFALEADALQRGIAPPRLGFFGVIDERLDLALIDHLAAERPGWQLVMVGPVAKTDPAALPRRANIHWLGLQPYELLPHLMAGWGVCLMPFALNDATRHISPTKTLEYLAGEKPVVSTAVPDVVSLYGDLVAVARTPAEFIGHCGAALTETAWHRAQRLALTTPTVFRTSWAQCARSIRRLIDEHLATSPARPTAAPAGPALAAAG